MQTKSLPNGKAVSMAIMPPHVHVVDPNGLYLPAQVNQIFSLRKSTLRREIRSGRLRVSKRAGRYFFLGSWLLEWIEGGEVRNA
jgi:hypothetical protein